jgi:hypothetical protein
VTTSGFELANEIDPALLDVGAVSVKSALVVVYREPGKVRAPSVVADVDPDINPVTSTGAVRFDVVPSPTLPQALCPQHFTLLPLTVAQVVSDLSALMESTPLLRPTTFTGDVRFVNDPSPKEPSEFRPQHFAAPPVVTTHE